MRRLTVAAVAIAAVLVLLLVTVRVVRRPVLDVATPAGALHGPVAAVRIDLSADADPATLRARLNGEDVSDALRFAPGGAVARVDDLQRGANVLDVAVRDRDGRPHRRRSVLEVDRLSLESNLDGELHELYRAVLAHHRELRERSTPPLDFVRFGEELAARLEDLEHADGGGENPAGPDLDALRSEFRRHQDVLRGFYAQRREAVAAAGLDGKAAAVEEAGSRVLAAIAEAGEALERASSGSAEDLAAARDEIERLLREPKGPETVPHVVEERRPPDTIPPDRLFHPHSQTASAGGDPRVLLEEPVPQRDRRSWRVALTMGAPLAHGQAGDPDLDPSTGARFDPADPNDPIVRTAAELGYDPIRIFEFVRNEIEFEPSIGFSRGARATLLGRRGSNPDQCALLVALLRASGYPARFVIGDVLADAADVRSWVQVLDDYSALQVFYRYGAQPTLRTNGGRSAFLLYEHWWVKTLVPYGPDQGRDPDAPERWVFLDPSFKRHELKTGVALPELDFDLGFLGGGYLGTVKTRTAVEEYAEQYREWLRDNEPGTSLEDAWFRGPIVREELGALPPTLPYQAVQYHVEFTDIEDLPPSPVDPAPDSLDRKDILRPRVLIELKDNGSTLFSAEFVQADIADRRISIGWKGETAADQSIIDNQCHGDLFECVDVSSLDIVPVLYEEGTEVAVGTTGVKVGDKLSIVTGTTSIFRQLIFCPSDPTLTSCYFDTNAGITAGDRFVLATDYGQGSQGLVDERVRKLLDAFDGLTPTGPGLAFPLPETLREDLVSELLFIGALRYGQRVGDERRLLGAIENVHNAREGLGQAQATLEVKYLADTPVAVVPRNLLIDIRYRSSSLSTDTRPFDIQSERFKRIFRLGLVSLSALEHQLWEELTQFPTVSTVKGFQLVLEDPDSGVQMAQLQPGQQDQIPYQLPQTVQDRIATDLANGFTVTVPTQALSINQWEGVVYFEERFDATSASMGAIITRLEDLANGGYTTSDVPLVLVVPDPYDTSFNVYVYRAADPVNVASGNLDHTDVDLEVTTRGTIPVVLSRTYHSQGDEVGPFGFGWTHSYHVYVEAIDEDADGVEGEAEDEDGVVSGIAVADGRGGLMRFGLAGGDPASGPFTPEPGVHEHAEALDDGAGLQLELRNRSGARFRFDALPAAAAVGDRSVLRWMEDANGNRTSLQYVAGRLDRVVDPLGRALVFGYQAGTDLVSTISDWTGRTWTYTYDGDDLQTVVDPLDQTQGRTTWTYDYYSDQLNPENDHNLRRVENGLGEGTTYAYYGNDKAYEVEDDLGARTRFTYDVFRRETTEIDPLGRRTVYQYDGNGFLTRRVFPDGSVQDYGYEPATRERNLEVDELGFETHHYYDAYGNPKGTLTPEGSWTSLVYYHEEHPTEPIHSPRFDKVVQRNDPRGTVFRFEYDPSGNLVLETAVMDVDGGPTTVELRRFEYDAFGNRTRALENIDPHTPVINERTDRVTEFRYGPRSYHLVATVDAHGSETTNLWDTDLGEPDRGALRRKVHERHAEYRDGTEQVGLLVTETRFDVLGRLELTRSPIGTETEVIRDAAGRVTDEIVRGRDETGSVVTRTTLHEYDAAGRRIRTTDPLGNDVQLRYDAAGNLVKAIDPLGKAARFVFDERDRRIATEDALGNVTRTQLDARGLPLRAIDATGVATDFEYDRDGRLLATTDASGNRVSFGYDANGNRTSILDARANAGETVPDGSGQPVPVTNSDGFTQTLVYDELDRLVEARDARDGRTTFELDLLGDQLDIENAASNRTLQSFDRMGRLVLRRDPLGREERFTYGSAGSLIELENRKGEVTGFHYDFAQRRVNVRFPDGTEADFGFDGFGNPVRVSSPEVTYVRSFDVLGRLVRQTDSRFSTAHRFTYDAAGRRTSSTGLDGATTQYRYDDVGRLIELRAPDGTEVERHYDGAGRLIAQYFSSGAHTKLSYEPNGRLDVVAHYTALGTLIEQESHDYDANGNRTLVAFSDATQEVYAYDALDRLRSATYRDGSDEEFAYDAVGNRTRAVEDGVERFYFYDAGNQLDHVAADAAGSNVLLSCVHDANGNRRSCADAGAGSWQTYEYDAQDRLVEVRDQAGNQWSYRYDALGQRLSQAAPQKDRMYAWREGNRVGEFESGSPVARATFGGRLDQLIQVVRGPIVGHAHADAVGSVRAISTAAGAVVASYEYRAFGSVLSETSTFENDFGFAGRERDSNGLVYFRARFYDPVTGRFLNEDPAGFGGGINLYVYASNNPTTLIDPTGLSPVDASGVSFFDQQLGVGGRIAVAGVGAAGSAGAGYVVGAILVATGCAASVVCGGAVAVTAVAALSYDLYNGGASRIADAVTGFFTGDVTVGQALEVGAIAGGVVSLGAEVVAARSATTVIATPYGPASQATGGAALAARTEVSEGATLWRVGTTGRSAAGEAQFWSLEHPLTPGYASRYGVPAQNIKNANFIESATIRPGTPFVTRQAPAVGQNLGGGIEVVVPEGGVVLQGFSHLGGL